MIDETALGYGPKGINNRARANALPEGYVRDMVNFLHLGGRLRLRPGMEQVYSGTDVTGMMAFGDDLLICDGTDVLHLDGAGAVSLVGSVVDGTKFTGDTLDGVAYIAAGAGLYEYDGRRFRTLTVPEVTAPPTIAGADSFTGRRLAMTYVDDEGRQGGCVRSYPAGAQVVVPIAPAGHQVALYVTEPDGSIYYHAATAAGGSTITLGPTDPSARALTTMGFRRLVPGRHLVASQGVLVTALGTVVSHSLPMHRHLCDPVQCFFQYGAEVTGILAGAGGLYVLADKCYKLTGVGTDNVTQEVVLDYPAVPGTGGVDDNGTAFWITRYGLAAERFGPRGPYIVELGRDAFTPPKATAGTAGSLAIEGENLVLVGTQGRDSDNPLAAADYYDAEVIRP